MSLNFSKTLPQALQEIELIEHHQFSVHPVAEPCRDHDSMQNKQIIKRYGSAKWAVVDHLNAHYGPQEHLPGKKFDLGHWLKFNEDDEVAWFLNEAGSNTLHYSQFL